MVLRATKQHVEILTDAGDAGFGDLRITKQYIEVLTDASIISNIVIDPIAFNQTASVTTWPTHLSVTDNIVLTQSVNIPSVYSRSITGTLVIGDSISYVGPILLGSSNSLTIQDFADVSKNAVTIISRDVNDIILFNEFANGNIDYTAANVTDNFTLGQEVGIIQPHRKNTSNTILFIQSVDIIAPRYIAIEDDLLSTETVFDPVENELVTTDTGLRQEVSTVHVSVPTAYSNCYLEQQVQVILIKNTALSHSASDHILLSDLVYYNHASSITDTITFSQIVTVDRGKGVKNYITLEQELEIHGTFGKTLADSLDIYQTLAYELQRENTLCTYSPFIGTSTDSTLPTPPRPTGPTLVKQNNIQFTYGATTLVLRGPEFGNRDSLKFVRINRESRGGTLTIYADPIWPQVQTILVEFYGLYETESQLALDFIKESLGKEIELRDWEGRSWKGVITNPDTPIIRNSKNNNTLSLELDIQSSVYNQEIIDTIAVVSISDRQHVHVRSISDILKYTITDSGTYPVLDWKTFTELEWDTFSSFEWNQFIGE